MKGNIPTLRQFLIRAEVLKLYRQILRTLKNVQDSGQKKELLEWARHDFRSNAKLTDEAAIKMMITYGKRTLKEVGSAINLSK